MQTNLKAVNADEPPDPLEAVTAEVGACERRLAERKRKDEEIAARLAAVEKEIRDGALAGDVAGLGALSNERAQLKDALEALRTHSVPALEEAVRSAKERCGVLHREATAVRRAEERKRREAELVELDAAVVAGIRSAVDALRRRPALLAALGRRTDEPSRLIGATLADVQSIADAVRQAEFAVSLERARGRPEEIAREQRERRERQEREQAAAPPPEPRITYHFPYLAPRGQAS